MNTAPPPTRPLSNDPADIARWQAQMDAEQERLQEERDFRDKMLSFAARMDTEVAHIKEGQQQHARDDLRQFRRIRRRQSELARTVASLSGTVSQTVTDHKTNWTIITAVAGAMVAIFGLLWTMFDKFWQGPT